MAEKPSVPMEEFRMLMERAGFRLTQGELEHLKPFYETALALVAPLHAKDFTTGEMAVNFDAAEPTTG
ncbi:MAG: hypothetical protein FJ312_01130 [SAR202 cluster bacterium]|nr:hypothetical protein [SAR202 cluster bacterium]